MTGLLALALVAVLIGVAIWLYNGLVGLRSQVGSAWAQIDVQLKRRHDLMPNLVSAVQGYMQHERELFDRITTARARALSATGAGAVGQAEGALTQAVGGLLAVMERYPDLKANQNVLALQEELVTTENRVGFARQLLTLVAALLGAVLLLSDWATRLRLGIPSSRSSKEREGDSGGGPLMIILLVVWLLTVLLTPLIGRLLATGVSRRREYLADASGAELTRNPLGLASALRKLHAATAPTARIYRGTAHLCIADPLGKAVNDREGWLADLLATHPPIGNRIARLEAMAYRPGA